MLAVNYSNLRENFKDYCDKAVHDAETVIVTRKNNENVVLMSLDEYNNLMENVKILRDPEAFLELYEAIKEIKAGHVVVKSMEELEQMEP